MAAAKRLKLFVPQRGRRSGRRLDEYCLSQTLGHPLHNPSSSARRAAVDVAVYRDADDQLVVTVTDTGVGIDARFLDRVFEARSARRIQAILGASRVTASASRSRRHLAMNRARISLDSTKGKGSTFTIHFSPTRELRDPARRQRNSPILHAED